ncbi:MAG TPA: cation:proton antiporter [Kofleriaceae bacterium]|nr:cation:proton antiporter [Kofleriaceae bacterium]
MIPILLLLAIGGLMQAARTFTATGGTSATELAFGFLLLTAFFMARLASRVGLPKLTGYLLAGVIGGPFVLELVTREMTGSLKIVNGVATCILGLTAGAELNLTRVRPVMRTLRWIIVIGVLGGIGVLAATLYLMRPMLPMFDALRSTESIAVCVVFAVALTPQSPAVVMALLSETRADGPLSQIMLASVVIADLVVVLCYAIAAAVAGGILGGGVDAQELVTSVSWELFGSMAVGVAAGMLIGQFVRSVPRGATMFALLICVIVAQIGSRIHLDPLIVTLAAGIWLENFSRADASALLEGFESAQLPVFLVWFALSGTQLDLAQLWAGIIPVLILAAARAGWFAIGTQLACRWTHAPPAVTRHSWIGLVPQAGLSLALYVTIQNNFPSFGAAASVMILSLLGVNVLVFPVLLRSALIRSGEAGKKQAADFAAHGATQG